jgi:hypothetical protein
LGKFKCFPSDILLPVTDIVLPFTDIVLPVTDIVWPVTDIVWPVTDIVLTVTDIVLPVTDKATHLQQLGSVSSLQREVSPAERFQASIQWVAM